MLDDIDSNSDDDFTDLESLFLSLDPKNEIFFFKKINTFYLQSINATQVLFTFNFGNKYEFQSKLIVDGCLTGCYDKLLFCIGMTSLLWYWMGFGTNIICVEAFEMTEIDILFWTQFYNEILLEYKYVNATIALDDIVIQSSKEATTSPIISDKLLFEYENIPACLNQGQLFTKSNQTKQQNKSEEKNKVLVPLGGKC